MTAKRLYLGSDFYVPEEAVTQTFAIFGKRGSGKSNAGTVLAEEMFKANLPFVVLDPVDAWWGLKANFDGKGPGLGVYVFGGPHGDLPLEPTGGALMADVMVEHQISAVLSFKGWTGGERTRFASDFAARLLAKNTQPLHVFLEEADAFIPQRPFKGEEVMLGNFDRLVRWGRQSGLGCTLITQRSAKVNKDVTTQAETLISFRVIGPQDRDAIDNWIKFHAGDDKRQEVLSSISTLKDGQAWVWSPEWLETLRRVTFRRRATYDSAATPKTGEKRAEPKQLAAVDLERLRAGMAATIEKAKQDDPRELRRVVADLRKQLAQQKPVATPAPTIERVEVPMLDPALVERLYAAMRDSQVLVDRIVGAAGDITEALNRVKLQHPTPRVQVARPTPTRRPTTSQARATAAMPDGFRVSSSQQRILDALGWLEALGLTEADKTQVALLADQSPTSGGYFNNLGTLRSAGLIEYPQAKMVQLTPEGRGASNPTNVPQTSEELQEQLYKRLSGSQAAILRRLVEIYDEDIAKSELAEQVGQSPTSGGYFNNLGRLRSLGLIDYPSPGRVAAQPVLFLEGARR